MRKNLENKVVRFAQKDSPHFISILATIFSLILIAIGVMTLIVIQEPIKKSQDLRQRAAIDTGLVVVTVQEPTHIVAGQPTAVDFAINTHGVQTDGVQVIFDLSGTNIEQVNISLVGGAGLSTSYQEVEKKDNQYHIALLGTPAGGLQTAFATATDVVFARLTFTPTQAGTVKLAFDETNSISTVHASDPPDDQLKTVPNVNLIVSAVTPSPTPTPTPSVSPSPSASPTISKGCNETCSSSRECPANYGCYDIAGTGRCRLANNVSSDRCETPADLGLNRTCNQYCADSRECAGGYTCFYNRCRLPANPDNTSCVQVITQIVQVKIANNCNQTCRTNRDCAANLRCYQNQCRWATNPSSYTCSPETAPTVSQYTGEKGAELDQTGVNSTTSARIVSSPIPTSSFTPLTALPIASPAPQPISPNQQSAWEAILENLQQRGINFPIAMIASGIGMIILVLVLMMLRSLRGNQANKPITYQPTSQDKKYLENLQQRIQDLKTPPAPDNPTINQPVSPQPMPPQTVTSVPAPLPPRPTPPPVITSSLPIASPPSTAGSSMLERLKQKGINAPS